MTKLMHDFFLYVYLNSLRVSSNLVLINRRINCITNFPTCILDGQSDIYQMLYWYNWFSWWWARGCSKHVQNWNKHIEKRIVRQVGHLQELYWDARLTEHKILLFLLTVSDYPFTILVCWAVTILKLLTPCMLINIFSFTKPNECEYNVHNSMDYWLLLCMLYLHFIGLVKKWV
jgi:hypothetical protein